MRTDWTAQGTLPSALWWPKWEGNSERGDIYILQLGHFGIQQKLMQNCKEAMCQNCQLLSPV